jgi:hypothetical protein
MIMIIRISSILKMEAKCSLKTFVMIYQTVPFHIYQTMSLHISDDNCQLSMWRLQIFHSVMILAGADVYDAMRLAACPGYVDTVL